MTAGHSRRAGGPALLAFAVAFASSASAREPVKMISVAAVATSVEARTTSPEDKPAVFEQRRVPPAAVAKEELSVLVDRAKIIRLPERTQTIVIGNPAVADIAVQKSGVVVLTGKSFGVTNFIALDNAGAPIAETMVSVSAPSDSTVMVQRGLDRQTYSCTPVCQPTVALGDAAGYFGESKGQVDAHAAFAGQR